jgi:hypothetical protein
MKKVGLILTVLLLSQTAAALENQNIREGRFFVSGFFGYGYNYTRGEIETKDGGFWIQDPKFGKENAYALRAEVGYMMTDWGAAVLGLAYEEKNLRVEEGQIMPTGKFTQTIKMESIAVRGGFRGFFTPIYYGAGLFAGFMQTPDRYTTTIGGTKYEFAYEEHFETGPEIGFYLEAGVMFPVYKMVNVNLGVDFEYALNAPFKMKESAKSSTYDASEWNLKTNLLTFQVGVSAFL